MKKLGPLVRIQTVEPLDQFRVRLTFKNGTQKEVDLEPFLQGELFTQIKYDRTLFRTVKVIGSTIGWDNGADIDPDVLYYDLKPAWMEELVPA